MIGLFNTNKITIDSSDKQTVVNYEVGNKLYPIATLHEIGDNIGDVTVDDRTNDNIIYNIANLLQLLGEAIKIALSQHYLTQNKA